MSSFGCCAWKGYGNTCMLRGVGVFWARKKWQTAEHKGCWTGGKYRESKSTDLIAQYTMQLVSHHVAAVPSKGMTIFAC